MEWLTGNIGEIVVGALLFAMRFWMKRDTAKQTAVSEERIIERVVERLKDEYVRLDYPNAKPIHDIHARLDVLINSQQISNPQEKAVRSANNASAGEIPPDRAITPYPLNKGVESAVGAEGGSEKPQAFPGGEVSPNA